MPNRILLIFITPVSGIGSASAQKYPERSLVRKGNRDFAKERYDRSIERYTQALEAAPRKLRGRLQPGGGALYRTEKIRGGGQDARNASPQTPPAPTRNGPRLSTTSATPNSNRKIPGSARKLQELPADESCRPGGQVQLRLPKRLLQKQQNEDQNKDQNKDQQNGGGQDQNQDKNKDNNSDQRPAAGQGRRATGSTRPAERSE